MTSSTQAPAAVRRYARVLSIAGSDSGGGAGIQADLKTFSALGCYGMTAITAITAQNTCGVTGIHGIPPEMLKAQIDAVVQDIGVDAVKIGMLHSPEVVRVVADAIRTYQLPHVVLDPVMVATSGDRLIAQETVAVLVQELFPLAEVITPNLDEAGWLLGRSIKGVETLGEAAQALCALGARAALLKGAPARALGGGCAGHTRRWAAAARIPAHRHAQRPWHGLHAVVRDCRSPGAGLAASAGGGARPQLHPGCHRRGGRRAHRPRARPAEPRLCPGRPGGGAGLIF